MMAWIILCSRIAAAGVRGAACLFLIPRLLSCRHPGIKSIAADFSGIAASYMLCSVAGLPGFYCIAAEALLAAACASFFQGADFRMGLFAGIFYEIAAFLWQFLFAAWLGVASGSPAFLCDRAAWGQLAAWVFHLALCALLWYAWRHPHLSGKKAFRFASAIVIVGFLAVVTLSEQDVLTVDEDTLDMWTLLSVVLMMSLLVFNMSRQYEAEKELARLKSEQAKLLERDYLSLSNTYAENAKLFHDFHNHIGVLRQILTFKNSEEAVRYLDGLQAPLKEMAQTAWTGDQAADYLINRKAAEAKESAVEYQAQVEFPRHTDIQSADLCAILGNLLDNALEAARKVQDPRQRFIHLAIRRINQMLVIKVENSYAAEPKKNGTDGMLETSKDSSGLHGWGLKSAQAAAQKYDGMVQVSYSGSFFRAVATLSFQGISVEPGKA